MNTFSAPQSVAPANLALVIGALEATAEGEQITGRANGFRVEQRDVVAELEFVLSAVAGAHTITVERHAELPYGTGAEDFIVDVQGTKLYRVVWRSGRQWGDVLMSRAWRAAAGPSARGAIALVD